MTSTLSSSGCNMSLSPSFDPWGSKSKSSNPEVHRHTCEPRGPPCQQMTAEAGDTPFSSGTAVASRSQEGSTPVGWGHGNYGGLHLYRRQFGDGAADAGCPQQSSFSCLQQSEYHELPEGPAEPHCFPPPNHSSCTSSSPVGQVSNRHYPNNNESAASKYFQMRQEEARQTLFPKPIYSYSTLIFMALMNSKTGSLPVSEIYSFMTEHFPYFKTAPDGWKNSVRHNLSLNKCFVKIENKSGSSSRKGCLWTLNPAKVEKMREELHKWRRKDPVTVRRSMARPECLDRLLGERPNRLRHYGGAALLPRGGHSFSNPARSRPAASPSQPRPSGLSPPCAPHAPVQPQAPCYPAPASGGPFALRSPCAQTAAVGGLNSPAAGMVPPGYGGTLQAEYSVSSRSIQDLVAEGYAGYDVDALNPSLIDLQLQGNVWEELQEDCLASDPQVCRSLVDLSVTPSCQQGPAASSLCQRTCEDQHGDTAQLLEHRGCLSGPHAAAYPGVEILAGYVTTCTTSISLM